jgi:hypothetical protein
VTFSCVSPASERAGRGTDAAKFVYNPATGTLSQYVDEDGFPDAYLYTYRRIP